MDIFLAILAFVCVVVGVLGSVVPVLPGPPISFLALLMALWGGWADYSTEFLVTWGAITAAVTLMDYYLPVLFTKKFGGSRKATWGATIGLVVGLFLGPVGIILGPFVGALAGEMINGRGQDNAKAWRVAMGAFLAFIFGTGLKLAASFIMAWYVIRDIFF